MSSLLHPLCLLVAVAALLYELRALRRNPRDLPLAVLCGSLTLSALSFAASLPSVWAAIDGAVGVPNIAALVSQTCVMLFVASQMVFLILWSRDRTEARRMIRSRLAVIGAALTTMTVLFFMTASRSHANPTDFTRSYLDNGYYAAYLGTYIAIYTVSEIELARLCLSSAKIARGPWLRRGMRITAAGAVICLGYSVTRSLDLAEVWLGVHVPRPKSLPWIFGDIGAIFTMIGWTIPRWGPSLTRIRNSAADYHDRRRLYRLWHAICTAVPSVALDRTTSWWSDIVPRRDEELRLYRRVIEILDGTLLLRHQVTPSLADKIRQQLVARGYAGDRLAAATEAMVLRHAFQLVGQEPRRPDDHAAKGVDDLDRPESFADQVRWLRRVADAFADLPHGPLDDVRTSAVEPTGLERSKR